MRRAGARADVGAVAGAKSGHHRYPDGEIFATRLPAMLHKADPSGRDPSTTAKNALAPFAKIASIYPSILANGPTISTFRVPDVLTGHGKPNLLVDSASGPVDWSSYRDVRAEEMTALIEAKVAGQPLTAPANEPVAQMRLLDVLKQSVAAVKSTFQKPQPRRRATP